VLVLDGLICADIAVRLAYGAFSAQDGIWYVLEPQFQATIGWEGTVWVRRLGSRCRLRSGWR
jgi:hypothetical protein